MSDRELVRPPQVTMAGWLIVAGSVAVVLTAFVQVSGLRSMETREAVEEYLSRPPGDVLGLGVQKALTLARIGLMVVAASAAATAVLGWQVLQRSRGARVALSLLVVPLLLRGLLDSSGLIGMVVVAAVGMLWFQPARDWFDGVVRAPLPAPEPRPEPRRDPAGEPTPARLLELPPPSAPPLYATTYAAAPKGTAAARPAPVTWACVITWLCTLGVFVLMGVALVQLVVTPDVYVDEFHRQNPELTMSDADVRVAFGVLFAVCVAWSAAAAGLALLVWRRVSWAAVALVASAALACVTLLPLVACLATIVLLLRPESRGWLRRSGRPSPAG